MKNKKEILKEGLLKKMEQRKGNEIKEKLEQMIKNSQEISKLLNNIKNKDLAIYQKLAKTKSYVIYFHNNDGRLIAYSKRSKYDIKIS